MLVALLVWLFASRAQEGQLLGGVGIAKALVAVSHCVQTSS